jgi:cell division cycle 20-like protein 1 (cofactor of APC complex)
MESAIFSSGRIMRTKVGFQCQTMSNNSIPYKVLDAPALQDDFYLNLIDWSNSNILAVGLGSAVYLWAPETGKVTKLCDLSLIDSISSLVWLKKTNHLGEIL